MQMEEGALCLEGTHLTVADFVRSENDRPSTPFPAKPSLNGELQIPGLQAAAFPEVDLSCPDEELVPILHSAASTWGFFRIFNHGIPQTLLESTAAAALRFFQLPLSDKLAIARTPPVASGYTSIARSSIIKAWSEALQIMPGEDRIRGLLERVSSFKDSQSFSLDIVNYFSLVQALASRIIRLLFCGLMVDASEIKGIFDCMDWCMLRINYYPACPVADLTYGSPPHKDFGGLAILYQDEVGGLEVLKDGQWIAVEPKKGCLIVNIGDLIQIVSNGRYRSVLHRSLVQSSQPRLSYGFFQYPTDDTLIAPMPKFVTTENPAKYKSFYMRDYKATFEKALKANYSPSCFFEEVV